MSLLPFTPHNSHSTVPLAAPLVNTVKTPLKPLSLKDYKALCNATLSPADIAEKKRFFYHIFFKKLLSDHRQSKCGDVLKVGIFEADVKVIKKSISGKYIYKGFESCNHITCPRCGPKKASHNADLVREAVACHFKTPHNTIKFLTFTFPHTRTNKLSTLIAKEKIAWAYFRTSPIFRKAKQLRGYVGDITANEATYSNANGWHPHKHMLWFDDVITTYGKFPSPSYSDDLLKIDLFKTWSKACVKAGLKKPTKKHGVHMRTADRGASDYLTKFGAVEELTLSHNKKGKKSRSVTQLLKDYSDNDDKRAGALFRHYVIVTKNRTGIRFSKGLKDLYDVVKTVQDFDDFSDSLDGDDEFICTIPFHLWVSVARFNQQFQVLTLIKNQGVQLAFDFMNLLYSKVKSLDGHKDPEYTDTHFQDKVFCSSLVQKSRFTFL